MPEKISCHLDWVRYTLPWTAGKTEIENLNAARWEGELFEFTGEEVSIGQGFNRGLKMNAGMILWHDTKQAQGISVQLTGKDLEVIRAVGMKETELLEWISSIGAHITTLHACMNIHDSGGQVAELIEEHKAGRFKSRAQRVGVYSSKKKAKGQWENADTLYVGSAKSPVQLRCYNKAAERGIAGDWIRIEVVWRGRNAQAAHCAMLGNGITSTLRGAIEHQVIFDLAWWKRAMSGETVIPYAVPNKIGNRYKWLRDSVIPALRSEIAEETARGDDALYLLFYDALKSSRPYIATLTKKN